MKFDSPGREIFKILELGAMEGRGAEIATCSLEKGYKYPP
jgi:hypothetical protein